MGLGCGALEVARCNAPMNLDKPLLYASRKSIRILSLLSMLSRCKPLVVCIVMYSEMALFGSFSQHMALW
jgi:hypothetical protein